MGVLRLVEVAQVTDTGLVRPHNEDRALAVPPLLVVADGMGGAKAGEVAAQMTIDSLERTGPQPSVDQVVEAIEDANREIRELSHSDADHAGMGTTVTALLVRDDGVTALHVGDSRAYVVRGDRIRQVTEDHSLVAELVRQGQITPQEAEQHPSRNIITRALGAEANVPVDRVPLALQPGDVVLVCSDGLTTMVGDGEIAGIVGAATSLRSAADALVQAALAGGGTDNVTVILGRLADADDDAGQTVGATAEIPAVAPAPTRSRPAAGAGSEPARATPAPSGRPAVLEMVARGRRPSRRPIAAIVVAALALVVALGTWAASRVYFVDARDGSSTARVYHGLPVSVLGIDLHTTWVDTGVDAATIRSAEPGALSGTAHGQGRAVLQAVNLIWRYGLPEIAVLQVPPATRARSQASSGAK